MATGEIQERTEVIPTLAFSTVCGRLGLTKEDEIMDAYKQIKSVLGVYTRYLENYIEYLKHRSNKQFHMKAVVGSNLELRIGGNRIWKIVPETVIRPGAGDDEWFVCDDDGEELRIGDQIQICPGRSGAKVLDEDNFKAESGMYWFKFPEIREQKLSTVNIFSNDKKIRPASFKIHEGSKIHVDGRPTEYRLNDDGTISIFSRVSGSKISVDGSIIGYDVEKMSRCPEGAAQYFDGYLIQSTGKPGERSTDITDEFLESCMAIDLFVEGKSLETLGFDRTSPTSFTSSESSISGNGALTHRDYPNLRIPYTLKQSKSDKYRIAVRDDYISDSGRDPWESMFDDNVQLSCGEKKIEPIRKNRESMEILLTREDARELGDEFEITVKILMGDLLQQKEALQRILKKPSLDYAPLYNLFLQKRGKGNWGQFEPAQEDQWYVLDDESYEGCIQQQNLVKSALTTPDFAVLDGPPGTGKTTAIRELIIKLILSGKRVLVASSTNAAIDNVLEWLIETDCDKNPELKEKLIPVRLGLEDKTSDRVKEYSMERMVKRFQCPGLEDKEIERIILDSSNLVCGTIAKVYGSMTPYVEKEEMWKRKTAYVPPFDYMIMDESSKTTFQEFIVPALYAKRWILAGDIRQLSPFTDEGAASNLLNLFSGSDSDFKIGDSEKIAINLINAFFDKRRCPKEVEHCVVIVQPPVWYSLKNQIATMEYTVRIGKRGQQKDIPITNGQHCFDIDAPDYMKIFDSRVLYVKPVDFRAARYYLGSKTYVIDLSGLKMDILPEFSHLRYRRYDLQNTDLRELMKNIDMSWEDQIRWRLEREYWLRNSKDPEKKKGYISQIYGFIPGAIYSDEAKRKSFMRKTVYSVQSVLYHSILELLTVEPADTDRSNLLQSFNDEELACRKVSLIYQYRMDPGISMTPRNEFYGGELHDGEIVKNREWDYYIDGADQVHSVWIQCATEEDKGSNPGEIEVAMSELRKFIAWAESNPKANGKPYEVIMLTFYQRQKMKMQGEVGKLELPENVHVKVATVDYIQGQEADVVFLSMVRRQKIGFMDTPNRLNVAITRARNLMVYIGDSSLFHNENLSVPELIKIVEGCVIVRRDQID